MNIDTGVDWSSHTHHEEFVYPPIPKNFSAFASVVIGNYNHSYETLSLIRRLVDYQKENIDIEIIVADTGSNKDQIYKLVHGIESMMLQGVLNVQVKVVIVDKTALRKTSPNIHAFSFGINAAVKVADGAIIIGCDSSVITPPNFIFEMVYPHTLNTRRVFVRAPLWDIKEENIGLINADEIRNTHYNEILAKTNKNMLKHSMGRPAWSLFRTDFIELGGFDEDMIYYGVADDDYVTRLLMTGATNIMSHSRVIHLWHPAPRNTNNDFNVKLMKRHIQEKRDKVNEGREWGKYDELIQL